jgi:hypothetical protein
MNTVAVNENAFEFMFCSFFALRFGSVAVFACTQIKQHQKKPIGKKFFFKLNSFDVDNYHGVCQGCLQRGRIAAEW